MLASSRLGFVETQNELQFVIFKGIPNPKISKNLSLCHSCTGANFAKDFSLKNTNFPHQKNLH